MRRRTEDAHDQEIVWHGGRQELGEAEAMAAWHAQREKQRILICWALAVLQPLGRSKN